MSKPDAVADKSDVAALEALSFSYGRYNAWFVEHNAAKKLSMNLLQRLTAFADRDAPDKLNLFEPHWFLNGDRESNEAKIRKLCQVAYLGENLALCRTLGRYKMVVDTTDHSLSPHLMLDGYWEMWVTEVIASQVKPGMIVADVGANLGYFTLLMAELVGPTGRVHAFEPNPCMFRLLRRNLDINGFLAWAELHEIALGESDGAAVAFVIPDNEPKNGHLQPLIEPGALGCLSIETQRLDSRDDWREIELAKIDVEGAEEMVWTGAEGLLASDRLKTIILEFTPARYSDAESFLQRIVRAGFSLNRIDPWAGLVPCDIPHLLAGDLREDRMLFLQR